MKVKELIEILKSADPEASVVVEKGNNDGCESCGYGESTSEYDISHTNDLETRVVLVT